jgi:hypothetical protein
LHLLTQLLESQKDHCEELMKMRQHHEYNMSSRRFMCLAQVLGSGALVQVLAQVLSPAVLLATHMFATQNGAAIGARITGTIS